jgi:hypothetical protein
VKGGGVQERSRGFVSPQQRLHPSAQLGIGTAEAVEDGDPAGSAFLFGGGEKSGLNRLGIDRHGSALPFGIPFSATSARAAVEKNGNRHPASAFRSQARA